MKKHEVIERSGVEHKLVRAGAGADVPMAPCYELVQPFCLAARAGDIASMRAFIASNPGLDVDTPIDEEGTTALHYAASNRQMEAIQVLLEKGANLFLQRSISEPKTPFSLIKGMAGAVEALIKDSVDVLIDGTKILLSVKIGRISIHGENLGMPDFPGRLRVGIRFRQSQEILPVLVLKKELGQDYMVKSKIQKKCELKFGDYPIRPTPKRSVNFMLNLPRAPLWIEDSEYEPTTLTVGFGS